jgi:hypothetical protein
VRQAAFVFVPSTSANLATMAVSTEFSLRLPNSPGALAAICSVLAEERVSIQAFVLGVDGVVRFVVDNPVRTEGVLRAQGQQYRTREVLVVPVGHTPGGMGTVARLLADAGVNVNYAYGAAGESSARGTVILAVDDPLRVATAAGL